MLKEYIRAASDSGQAAEEFSRSILGRKVAGTSDAKAVGNPATG